MYRQCGLPVLHAVLGGLICEGNGLSLYYRQVLPTQVFLVFWFDVRILYPVPLLQSLYHFRRVLSRAQLNLFENLIWLNDSMVIAFPTLLPVLSC